MPRVAKQPRGHYGQPPAKQNQSPLKIPLNDDRQEKAIRFQSRQALHDIQINQIKAAASPMRKASNHISHGSPQTPEDQRYRGKENYDDDAMLSVIPNNSMTPMRRVPILANFEEWMKMATDNKINATNSWNFALIDYFHDMSLLKEGDGVNFQKASCTLDGCVKIYTSRVDSVATETGKLLSGLADGTNKRQKRDDEAGDDHEEGDEDDADGVRKRAKKKTQRSSETTLASSFAQLQLKKLELEFTVDPLFKKASADFDEGGAKGLLLNHLAVNSEGRIVFDSSDDGDSTEDTGLESDRINNSTILTQQPDDVEHSDTQDQLSSGTEANISGLSTRYFPDLDLLDEQDICPSLKNFDAGDPKSSLDLPNAKDPSGIDADPAHFHTSPHDTPDELKDTVYDDDDDAFGEAVLLPEDAEFGDGGEAWAQSAAVQSGFQAQGGRVSNTQEDQIPDEAAAFELNDAPYSVAVNFQAPFANHDNILQYFDKALSKNWAGPEHWRIKRIKDSKLGSAHPPRRKEKETFEIDFTQPLDLALAEMIYTPASSASIITLPKTQWRSRTRNLLPDDKHFNSRQLLRLFLKPRARVGSTKPRQRATTMGVDSAIDLDDQGRIDEAFWARQGNTVQGESLEVPANATYDANFFQDDGLGMAQGLPDEEDDFADAREAFTPDFGSVALSHDTIGGQPSVDDGPESSGAFGSQLVTQSKRLRPDYVQYARVAKKVDVRRLKEEMWKGIGLENTTDATNIPNTETAECDIPQQPLQFTSVMNSLQDVYPTQAMADISTSYCFICLLHLANEKSLRLENDHGLEELSISRDTTVAV